MKVTVQVKGLPELKESMRRFSDEVKNKITRGMTNAGIQVIKKDAIRRAPQSERAHLVGGTMVQPGNLKRNILVKRLKKSETRLTHEYAMGVRSSAGEPGRDAFYWRFKEFGTVKESPQPFIRPALESNKGEALNAVVQYGKNKVEAAARKAAVKKT